MAKDAREHHTELRAAYIRAQHDLVGNDKWSVKDEDNLDVLEDMVKAMVINKTTPKSLLRPATPAPLMSGNASEIGQKAVGDALAPNVDPSAPTRPRGFA